MTTKKKLEEKKKKLKKLKEKYQAAKAALKAAKPPSLAQQPLMRRAMMIPQHSMVAPLMAMRERADARDKEFQDYKQSAIDYKEREEKSKKALKDLKDDNRRQQQENMRLRAQADAAEKERDRTDKLLHEQHQLNLRIIDLDGQGKVKEIMNDVTSLRGTKEELELKLKTKEATIEENTAYTELKKIGRECKNLCAKVTALHIVEKFI
jgi:hypothetical protein